MLWGPVLGNFVQYLELVNYHTAPRQGGLASRDIVRKVWIVIFSINATVLTMATFLMAEPGELKKEKEEEPTSAVSKVIKEVLSYRCSA